MGPTHWSVIEPHCPRRSVLVGGGVDSEIQESKSKNSETWIHSGDTEWILAEVVLLGAKIRPTDPNLYRNPNTMPE